MRDILVLERSEGIVPSDAPNNTKTYIDPTMRLLRSLAEELKLPLLQIAGAAELGQTTKQLEQLRNIEVSANGALKLLDSYLLSTQLTSQQGRLNLQPVSVTATMYDVAQELYKFSKLNDTEITIEVNGKCGQAMAHPRGLLAALTSLAHVLVSTPSVTRQHVTLLAHKTPDGISVGALSNIAQVSKQDLKLARTLYGNARQPTSSLTHTNGAGLYLADSLFNAMESSLKVSHYRSSVGFSATLLPSYQLSLL